MDLLHIHEFLCVCFRYLLHLRGRPLCGINLLLNRFRLLPGDFVGVSRFLFCKAGNQAMKKLFEKLLRANFRFGRM